MTSEPQLLRRSCLPSLKYRTERGARNPENKNAPGAPIRRRDRETRPPTRIRAEDRARCRVDRRSLRWGGDEKTGDSVGKIRTTGEHVERDPGRKESGRVQTEGDIPLVDASTGRRRPDCGLDGGFEAICIFGGGDNHLSGSNQILKAVFEMAN